MSSIKFLRVLVVEARANRRLERLTYIMVVIFLISIVFLLVIQYEMGFQIYIKLRKDPPGIICDQVTKSFGDNLPYMATLEYYYLEVEWEGNRFSNLNDKISRTGALPCFC